METHISVLVVEDEESVQKLVAATLTHAGYEVTLASNGMEALKRVGEAQPHLIVSDVTMPDMDGLELLRQLRANPATTEIAVILLTAKDTLQDVVGGLELGADDYLIKPFRTAELLARVQAKIERPPVPQELSPRDRQSGLLSERRFREELVREISRASRGGASGCLAYVDLDELPRVRERFGRRAEAEIAKQVAALIENDAGRLELAGRDAAGRFILLLPGISLDAAQQRLEQVSRRIAAHPFLTGGETLRLTPALGYVALTADESAETLAHRALLALEAGIVQLDLHPVRYSSSMEAAGATAASTHSVGTRPSAPPTRPWVTAAETLRVPFQIAVTLVLGLLVPLLIYALWGAAGMNIAPTIYVLAVLVMLFTATLITIEGFLALRAGGPPDEPGAPYPAASAIIAAYLPNEAPVILETIEAFLRVNYPAPLQVILAYNTPRDMPVEAAIQEIARRDSRFTAIRVESSTSKAQNVNAALALVNGEFVGVFDADHHPEPDSFMRAWRWLSNGYDVVQGHCLVRNGDASWVARLAAVEFETIYAVSHPGRARLHGFGVFGGSNGYWRTERLRQTRMRGWMLTEDIDSSIRVVQTGGKIASDPRLISRELAPVTLPMLWHQRMRWAQGWFQVSFRHLEPALRSPHLSLRQKLGLVQLLGWREIYPWLSLQIIPILIYHIWWRRLAVDWLAPFFLFTTLLMLSNRPAQVVFSYYLAHPDIRRRKGWWVSYFILSLLFYMEFKNVIARVAHIKEFMRERKWVVTPRARASAP